MGIGNLNFRHLQYFLEVARTENMNEAARRIMISPTAVFSTIRRIEQEAGHPLFDRVGRNIRLNENGRIFREFAEITLERVKEAENRLEGVGTKKIKIGVINPVGFSCAISGILHSFEDVQLEHRLVTTGEMQSERFLKDFDLVFAALNDISLVNWKPKLLCETEPCLVVPPSHRLAGRQSVSLRECMDEGFIFLRKDYSMRKYTDHLFSAAQLEPRIAAECEYSIINPMLRAGIGITLSSAVTKNWDQYPGMCYVPISDPLIKRFLALYHNEDHMREKPCLAQIIDSVSPEQFSQQAE